MDFIIRGSPEEIAALVLAVQERPSEAQVDAVVEELLKGLQKAAAGGTSPS